MSPQIYEYGRPFYLLFSSISFFSVLQYFRCRGFLYPCLGLFRNYFCFALFACFYTIIVTLPKKIYGRKGLFYLRLLQFIMKGSQLRNSDHGGMLLMCLSSLASYTVQDHLQRDGTAQTGLDLPTSAINPENAENALQAYLQPIHGRDFLS